MTQERKTIKQLRNEHGMTQFQLASQTGISLSMISGIESRRNQPSVALAIKLASVFGVAVESVDWPSDSEVSEKRAGTKKVA